MHAPEWDSHVSRAAAAGDKNLTQGASSYQLGDRHAWKAMNMYQTTAQRQTQEIKNLQIHSEHEPTAKEQGGAAGVTTTRDNTNGNILEHDITNTSAPTMAAYASQVLALPVIVVVM